MYMLRIFLIILLSVCFYEIQCAESNLSKSVSKPYKKCPWVSSSSWKEVQPYLLPEKHPIRAKLDKIFKSSRATESRDSMRQAGFIFFPRVKKKIVATHPDLPGYIIKTYVDSYCLSDSDYK